MRRNCCIIEIIRQTVGCGPARRDGDGLFIKTSARDDSKYIRKSEHALMLKKREDELITDMRNQLVKAHEEIRKQTAEAVEAAISDQRAEITRLEKGSQHFVDSLA